MVVVSILTLPTIWVTHSLRTLCIYVVSCMRTLKTQIRKQVGECLINSAVFGTGVAEVVLEEVKEMAPATQPIMDGQLQAVGVNVTDRTVVKLRPVLPQNFLIDPVATSIQDAIGVAVDEFVPRHKVQQLQEEGVYRSV